MNLKRLFMALILPFACFAFANAQDKVVTGRVTDSKDGTPLQSITVMVKGITKGGTQTAADGSFRISVPANATTLVFSSVGYTSQEVAIGNGNLNVSLVAGTGTNLNEVVVVGYGTTRKKDLTGSVATVTSKDFQKGVISTPEQLISGKLAGVSIISNGGQPGSGSTIRIRGGSSLSASNDPLIVIDGVPVSNSGIAGGNNPLSFINPNDIESFTVLKDASAAAIYGTRAANGVILITTKKGSGGKLKMNFTTVNSVSYVSKYVDVLSGDEVRQIVNQLGSSAKKAQLGTANTDWQKEIYQTALATDNNLSISGGLKSLPYRVSLGYLNQEGIVMTDHLQRLSASISLTPTLLNNHLKVNLNLKGTQQKYRFANTGAIGAAINFDPTKPVNSGNSKFGGYYEWLDPNPGSTFGHPWNRAGRNPVAMLNDYNNNSNSKRSIGNLQLDYKFHFLPDLHANLNLGYDVSRGTGTIYVSDSSSLEYTTGGERNQYKQTKTNTVLEFYLNYAKDITSIKSRIDATAGYSYNNFLTTNYAFAAYRANGTKVPQSDPKFPFDKPENTLISVFGRLNYTLHDRYLLTATVRRDGSSRFAPSNRWGTFPSVALAWKIKDESFLKRNSKITDLKLRLGYGITGQQEGIGNYDYLSYYSLSDSGASYSFGGNYYQMYKPGGFYANRKWEQTTTYNMALDYGFWDNRITGSIDFYIKKTKDLLNSIPQPAGTNFAAFILANVGSMENRGVEFSINVLPIKRRDLTWEVSFNATYNKNKITQLTIIPDDPNYAGFPTMNIAGSQGFAFINAVGTSRNTFYLYHQIYDQAGNPIEGLFEDLNRDGIINEKDKYKGKRSDPNMFFGFSTNMTFKKWNAGFVMRAHLNNYLYNNIFSDKGRVNSVLNDYVIGNASTNYLETRFAGNTEQQPLSDYYIENASFLKMDNIYVGYNVGRILKNKASLRANLSVQNVFTITKYKGLDPEVGWGVDNTIYPRPRMIALGLNLDF